tara:strand:+ start:8061 stop:8663 length:603 start_codon:yes stop_codon:yes gene_type:complete
MENRKNYKVGVTPPPLPEIEEAGGELNFFDPANPDINLFNMVDDEMIRISGSEIFYYPYMQGDSQFDEVYMEERNKPIAREPITVYGHYEPKVLEETLSQFGIELTNDQIFVFNKSYMEQRIKGYLKAGDVLQPRFQNQKYEVFEVQEDSFEIYGVYHLVCSAKLLRDSEDVQNTPLSQVSDRLSRPETIKTLEENYDDL